MAVMLMAGAALAQAETTSNFTAAEALQNVGKEATVTDKVERVNKASGGNTFMSLGSAIAIKPSRFLSLRAMPKRWAT